MRTFYRDLTLLEEYKIAVRFSGHRYELITPLDQALRPSLSATRAKFRRRNRTGQGAWRGSSKTESSIRECYGLSCRSHRSTHRGGTDRSLTICSRNLFASPMMDYDDEAYHGCTKEQCGPNWFGS